MDRWRCKILASNHSQDINCPAVYTVPSNGTIYKGSCRKFFAGEQLAVLSVKMAVISHKIVHGYLEIYDSLS